MRADPIANFAETRLKSINIEFQGQVAELNIRPLVSAVLDGLLKAQIENVNMVSAPVIARDRGIDISETIHEGPGDYETLIRLTVHTERRSRSVLL